MSRALVLAAGFVGTIFAANATIAVLGPIPVGFGLLAPAGVYFAGLTFTLRDLLHDAVGVRGVLAAVAVGALASGVLSPAFALASGTAFLVSELADLLVYAPLRRRRWLLAVALSNVVGLLADSALFLVLAFGSLQYFPGQVVGKLWVTGAAVLALWGWRRAHRLPDADCVSTPDGDCVSIRACMHQK